MHNSLYSSGDAYLFAELYSFRATPSESPPDYAHIVQNNVVAIPYSTQGNQGPGGVARFDISSQASLHADYNALYAPHIHASKYRDITRGYTLSEWQARGLEINGLDLNSTPFVDAAAGNLRLAALSPCASAGTGTVAPWCRVDADGRRRPQLSPSMGAYEP
ncbi:MAG: hypothetical protein GX537_07750 [Actinobacteria bacterium]|nr:hypothetical protein [Actinomycetota bacterium]